MTGDNGAGYGNDLFRGLISAPVRVCPRPSAFKKKMLRQDLPTDVACDRAHKERRPTVADLPDPLRKFAGEDKAVGK